MDKELVCYCGLTCECCSVMTKVTPAAKALYQEMLNSGFENIMPMISGADGFWPFLKQMATTGICISCEAGSGNPACEIRICAKEKGVAMCGLCDNYPCEILSPMFEGLPTLKPDNDLLREKGWDAWEKMQDERKASGFTY